MVDPIFLRRLLAILLCLAPLTLSGQALAQSAMSSDTTADHTKFESLHQSFASGPDVTKACLTCHTEAAKQVMATTHWTWEYKNPETGQMLGKKNVINSFCGNVRANEPRCTSCHVGYGWTDMDAGPPKDETKVDCIVCHDTTGTYSKWPTHAGHPLYQPLTKKGKTYNPPNLTEVAQHVGLPGRKNCGACHFFGGGGDNVKHGDLSTALYSPALDVDVHMSPEGQNFACTNCHVSEAHKIDGSRYATHAAGKDSDRKPGERRDVATCASCHTDQPHPTNSLMGLKLNDHTNRVACQTCHIPSFARGGVATKTVWDWSTAGKLKDGKPYTEEGYTQGDGKHLHTYMSQKGDFVWEENVTPYYAWFDGQMIYTLPDDTIDPDHVVEVNKFNGSAEDPNSRIWPFKRMEGRQAYDKQYKTLLFSHVYGPDTDTAFWTNFDWEKALTHAQKVANHPFSGDFGFIDTYMYWPITHMVAPKEDALRCDECHSKDGRMAGIDGIYMPGRDANPWVDRIGLLAILLTIAGIAIHGGLRLIRRPGSTHSGGEK